MSKYANPTIFPCLRCQADTADTWHNELSPSQYKPMDVRARKIKKVMKILKRETSQPTHVIRYKLLLSKLCKVHLQYPWVSLENP